MTSHCIVLDRITLHGIVLQCIVSDWIVLHCIVSYVRSLTCIVLLRSCNIGVLYDCMSTVVRYCIIVLYCMVLYCVVVYGMALNWMLRLYGVVVDCIVPCSVVLHVH